MKGLVIDMDHQKKKDRKSQSKQIKLDCWGGIKEKSCTVRLNPPISSSCSLPLSLSFKKGRKKGKKEKKIHPLCNIIMYQLGDNFLGTGPSFIYITEKIAQIKPPRYLGPLLDSQYAP